MGLRIYFSSMSSRIWSRMYGGRSLKDGMVGSGVGGRVGFEKNC